MHSTAKRYFSKHTTVLIWLLVVSMRQFFSSSFMLLSHDWRSSLRFFKLSTLIPKKWSLNCKFFGIQYVYSILTFFRKRLIISFSDLLCSMMILFIYYMFFASLNERPMARIFQLLLIFVASHWNYQRLLRRCFLQPSLGLRLQRLSYLIGADCSVADRVRGRTGRSTSWTTLSDRRVGRLRAFRRRYREKPKPHAVPDTDN